MEIKLTRAPVRLSSKFEEACVVGPTPLQQLLGRLVTETYGQLSVVKIACHAMNCAGKPFKAWERSFGSNACFLASK